MKVAVVAGGRFHAINLAHELEKRNCLKKLFISGYTKKDRSYISPSLVCNNNYNKFLDYFFSKLKLYKFINKSSFYVFKDNAFDYWLNKKVINLGQVDIFVCWAHYFLNSLSSIRKTGAKVILESGSCHILEQQELIQKEYDKFGVKYPAINKKNIEKILAEYEQADYIMTISDFVYKSFIKRDVAKEKLLKVTCGVDVDYFASELPGALRDATHKDATLLRVNGDFRNLLKPFAPRSSPELVEGRASRGVLSNGSNKRFRVIFVGLLCLRKGVQYLLQAWSKLNLPIDQTELILVGNIQKDLVQVLKKIKILPNVNFYGSTDKETLKKLYESSDLFVLPSVEDGFGMVIGEAMATGLPVICSSNTAGLDLVQDNKHGFIVPACDANSLAEKILWCYENRQEAEYMGQLGREHVKKFSWGFYGQNVFDVYKKILNK